MSKRAILNRIISVIEKQSKNTATNLSFSIYLDDSPPEVYRTRGYNAQSNHTQSTTPQTEDTSND